MTNSNITWSSIPNNFVGFNELLKDFEVLMDRSNYPPYNVYTEKTNGGQKYYIEMAVTGLNKDEVEVAVENSRLIVTANARNAAEFEGREILHNGLTKKGFVRSFVLRPDIVVKSAKVSDGLLTIELEYVLPDTKKRRSITVL